MFFTLSSYPCCFISFFSPLLVGRGSVSDFHHLLLGCGSFCTSLSPLALWLWSSLSSSPETLCGTLQFPGCLACTSNTTAQHCDLCDRWLAVRARAPWSCSSQQRVLLTLRAGLRGRCRCGPSVVSNTTPTPLCDSLGCVHPHNEGSHRGLATAVVRRFGTAGVSSILVSLCRLTSLSLSHATLLRVLMNFSLFLFIVTCFAMSFALRRLIPERFFLALHAGATHAFELCEISSLYWMRIRLLFPLAIRIVC